jgi:uncharacterized protein
VRIGLISDTHGKLRPEVFDVLKGVDLILHAGDIGPPELLTELEAIAPVHAVWGNTDDFDVRARVQEIVQLEAEGLTIVVAHGHQVGSPSAQTLIDEHPNAQVIVYGHTHTARVDDVGGVLVVNPGAAGPARFRVQPSVAVLTVEAGKAQVEILPL